MKSNLDLLNEALEDSGSEVLNIHAKHDQPIVYRDNQNRLIEEYSDGRIVIIKEFNAK